MNRTEPYEHSGDASSYTIRQSGPVRDPSQPFPPTPGAQADYPPTPQSPRHYPQLAMPPQYPVQQYAPPQHPQHPQDSPYQQRARRP